jgi:hypothetical protein
MAANPEILAALQSQMKELMSLKAELDGVTRELTAGPSSELLRLREEVEQLKAEQAELAAREARIPPQYRVPPHYVPSAGKHNLFANQKLFPPRTPEEALTGRVRVLPPGEYVYHPLPFERPQRCPGNPDVITRVTCTWDSP